jgi:hypothetical protein
MRSFVTIQTESGDAMAVAVSVEGDREVGKLLIDGVPYHVERIKAVALKRDYCIDGDEAYTPQHDKNGMCVIVAPYSEK